MIVVFELVYYCHTWSLWSVLHSCVQDLPVTPWSFRVKTKVIAVASVCPDAHSSSSHWLCCSHAGLPAGPSDDHLVAFLLVVPFAPMLLPPSYPLGSSLIQDSAQMPPSPEASPGHFCYRPPSFPPPHSFCSFSPEYSPPSTGRSDVLILFFDHHHRHPNVSSLRLASASVLFFALSSDAKTGPGLG